MTLSVKTPSTRKVLTVSFLVNILDVVTNLAVYLLTRSATIFSGLMQGIADLVTSTFLLIGLSSSKRPAESTHPFGHGKESFFWSLMATIFMFGVSSSLSIVMGFNQLTSPTEITAVYIAIIVSLVSLITNSYALFLSLAKISRKGISFLESYKKSSRTTIKTQFISDLIGTVSAVIGIASLTAYLFTKNPIFDAIGAIFIGITLAGLSLFLFWEIKSYLVGHAASPELQNKIIHIVENVKGVIEVVDINTMYIGPSEILVNVEVNLDNYLVTDDIEKIMDNIRENIRVEIPAVTHIQIEVESPNIL